MSQSKVQRNVFCGTTGPSIGAFFFCSYLFRQMIPVEGRSRGQRVGGFYLGNWGQQK